MARYLVSWWPRCRHNVLRGLHAAVRHHGQGQVLVRLHGGAQGGWQLAKFMAKILAAINLRVQGQLHALDTPRSPPAPSVWSRVATNEVLLYDVLYGEYFKSPGGETVSISTFHIEESKNPAQSATRQGRTLSWLAGTQTPRWCSCPTVQSTPRYTAPPWPGPPGYPSN